MIRGSGALLLSLCVTVGGCQSAGPAGVQTSHGGAVTSEADGLRASLEESRKKQEKARNYLLTMRDALNLGLNRRQPTTDEALRLLERLQATGDTKVKDIFERLLAATTNRTLQDRLGAEMAIALLDGAIDALK